MEASVSDDNTRVNVESVIVDESVKNIDIEVLLTRIQEVYEDIVRMSTTDPESSTYKDFLRTSFMGSKSAELAGDLLNESKQFWSIAKTEEALSCVTRSIAFADPDSMKLGQAHYFRHQMLLALKKFKSCVQNIIHIIEEGIPLNEVQRQDVQAMYWFLVYGNPNLVRDQEERNIVNSEWLTLLRKFEPPDASLPSTSPKLKVDLDEKQETCLLAIEDVQPGEILSIENVYATSLDRKNHHTNCSFCLLNCDYLIPCPTCSVEMYCSLSCRKKAFESFHEFECKFIKFYGREKMDPVTPWVVRKFLVGTENGRQLPNLMKDLKTRDIFTNKSDIDSRIGDYRSTLQMHRMVNWSSIIMEHVVPVVEIIIVLLRVSFFRDSGVLPDCLGEVELFAALLLLDDFVTMRSADPRIMMYCPNENFLSEGNTRTLPLVQVNTRYMGIGIGSLQTSLIKPSCNPNTKFFIQKGQLIVFATRTIRSGEKLSSNYYAHPFTHSRKKQRNLERHFVCECEACLNNWPEVGFIRCKEISLSSLDEKTRRKVKQLTLKTQLVFLLTREHERRLTNKEIIESIINVSQLLCIIMAKPSYDLILCEQLLELFIKVTYCEIHRQYKNCRLDDFYREKMTFIRRRIEPLLTKFQ